MSGFMAFSFVFFIEVVLTSFLLVFFIFYLWQLHKGFDTSSPDFVIFWIFRYLFLFFFLFCLSLFIFLSDWHGSFGHFALDRFVNFNRLVFIFVFICYLLTTFVYKRNGAYFVPSFVTVEYLFFIGFFALSCLLLVSSINFFDVIVIIESQSFLLFLFLGLLARTGFIFVQKTSLKLFILNSFFGGLALFGCSLIYFYCGTLSVPELYFMVYDDAPLSFIIYLGFFFIFVSFFFKLAFFPFYEWYGDFFSVFHYLFLSFYATIPKIAIFVALLKFFFIFFSFPHIFSWILCFMVVTASLFGLYLSIFEFDIKRFLAYATIPHSAFFFFCFFFFDFKSIWLSLIYVVFGALFFMMILFMFGTATDSDGRTIEVLHITHLYGLLRINSFISYIFYIFFSAWAGLPPFFVFFVKFFMFSGAYVYLYFFVIVFFFVVFVVSFFYYVKLLRYIFFGSRSIRNIYNLFWGDSVNFYFLVSFILFFVIFVSICLYYFF
jgi:NADH-quinone oxidoreductase subunit N